MTARPSPHKGGSGSHNIALSRDGGRAEPGGPERAGRKDRVKAVTSEAPLNMTQKWLGHARLSTTAIYTNAIGPEQMQIAERMWL